MGKREYDYRTCKNIADSNVGEHMTDEELERRCDEIFRWALKDDRNFLSFMIWGFSKRAKQLEDKYLKEKNESYFSLEFKEV